MVTHTIQSLTQIELTHAATNIHGVLGAYRMPRKILNAS